MSPLPWVNVPMKAWRSRSSAIARRRSGLSKGGAERLMTTVRSTFVGISRQIACGAWMATSFSIGTCRKYGEVMSN
jgi:hypothetical protein